MPASGTPRAKQDANVAQFDVDPCGDGYVVVEVATGRPMTSERDWRKAKADAGVLNAAVVHGRRALARALGAVEQEDDLAALAL